MSDEILLSIKNLKTHFAVGKSIVKAVDGVSFDLKSGKGKSGVATIYGTTVDGEEIIIGYQTIRPKQGPGSKHQDTIQFHKDFQKRLVEQTEKLDD